MSTSPKRAYHTALSFAEEQITIAASLHIGLLETGIQSYFYPTSSSVGKTLKKEISAIFGTRAQSAIVILSNDYLRKPTCISECQAICERLKLQGDHFPVVPIVTDKVIPEQAELPNDLIYLPWENNPMELAMRIGRSLANHIDFTGTKAGQGKTSISVKANSIRTNINAGTIRGNLNID